MVNQVILKKKRKWKIEDLTVRDMDLLSQASYLPEKNWFCFGMSFYKLVQLEAVDEDTLVTPFGRELVRAYERMRQ